MNFPLLKVESVIKFYLRPSHRFVIFCKNVMTGNFGMINNEKSQPREKNCIYKARNELFHDFFPKPKQIEGILATDSLTQ